jgi:hypothetical protein
LLFNSALNIVTVQCQIIYESGAVDGIRNSTENLNAWTKLVSLTLCVPQIQHELARLNLGCHGEKLETALAVAQDLKFVRQEHLLT